MIDRRTDLMGALTVLVSHDIHEGKLQAAADRINGNGERMAKQPGFVSRTLYASNGGADKVLTITVWESSEAYEAWVAHNRANNPNAGIPAPFGSSPAELFYEYGDAAAGAGA